MKYFRWIPPYQLTLAVAAVILYLTLLPKPFGEEDIPLFPGADKLAHCCMFGGLALTFIFERYRIGKKLTLGQSFMAATIVSVFGIAVEFIQNAMHIGRSGDIADAIADIIGAFAAVPLCYWLHWIDVVVKHRSGK
ncbi:MAG: VanZ family protein [Duncaniella sp.]|uniref:VanZ family protein n=1 Tax=Duncaniella sp. TaxID=2518496 RepID=UPI0023CBF176|nr:VanZ family protein [Duncaniella sp.]MDE6091000.1 VanZ family protein [Duncaniella sp.]